MTKVFYRKIFQKTLDKIAHIWYTIISTKVFYRKVMVLNGTERTPND